MSRIPYGRFSTIQGCRTGPKAISHPVVGLPLVTASRRHGLPHVPVADSLHHRCLRDPRPAEVGRLCRVATHPLVLSAALLPITVVTP